MWKRGSPGARANEHGVVPGYLSQARGGQGRRGEEVTGGQMRVPGTPRSCVKLRHMIDSLTDRWGIV
jgi:hypothetical protein